MTKQTTEKKAQITEGFKEFENEVEKLCIAEGQQPKVLGAFTYKVYKLAQSHFHSLFLTLANERIESLREKLEDKRPYWQTDEERVGYEYALSEEIKYWESFIKELNEIR